MTTDFFADQDFQPAVAGNVLAPSPFAFTIDVEEWFQVGAFENTLSRADWPDLESRVDFQTRKILGLLEKLDIHATFFTLGWVAERVPQLIRDIAEAGHEVACHGMDHRRIFTMSREQFRDDLCKAKTLLEAASGCSIKGYRAPSFSLVPETWWVYEELSDAGFRYSSSLYPVKTDHYGAGSAPRLPFYPIPESDVIEIPMTVCDFPGRRLPASGGGYFRLLPYAFSKLMFKRAVRQTGGACLFYMHPWEVDPEQPYIKHAPLLSRFRHYTGQRGLPDRLYRLGQEFSWDRMDRVYASLFEHGGARSNGN